MQKITTFLTFDNQAEEAAKFYTAIFKNSKILTTTHYPEGAPAPKGTVMTVAFQLDGQDFVALNGGPSFKFSQGMSLMVNCETQAEVDDFWEKLLAGGGRPVACGWLTDRFGVSWQVVPTILLRLIGDSDTGKAGRVMKAMMQMVKLDVATIKRAAEQG
jgi:predicted 3-demethylubiquinone-9 3-methyltransferase (glyoxalase superfamily)